MIKVHSLMHKMSFGGKFTSTLLIECSNTEIRRVLFSFLTFAVFHLVLLLRVGELKMGARYWAHSFLCLY